ncbi:DUF2939 domain-containing protein [Neokomagataea anthophila]|uniref:DUF2939 domain-containing protein n=1 Tax=Neokomagataea anthophila TaxID=2826925 RepID=A0ABS5E785_9PROT|nr:DUF2939 domain-containing protein [Neokomagataea anthophila]MBR0559762.1 DUF2939 domain-containing protein [Neokomagataea anthophila]
MSVALAPFFANKRISVKRIWSLKKRIAMICVMLSLAAYAVSPLITLWMLQDAILRHDAQCLQRHVDWSALSYSLRDTLSDQQNSPEDDDLPSFGHSFATAAAAHVIEKSLTPLVLLAVIEQGAPFLKERHDEGTCFPWRLLSLRFVGIRHFNVMFKPDVQTTYTLHLTFEHWGWKVTGIDLPHNLRQA